MSIDENTNNTHITHLGLFICSFFVLIFIAMDDEHEESLIWTLKHLFPHLGCDVFSIHTQ